MNTAKIMHKSSLNGNSLFSHPLWEEIDTQSFGLLSIIDTDSSLTHTNTLTDSTDLSFLLLSIPNEIITKGEYVTITITSGNIVQKTISFSSDRPISTVGSDDIRCSNSS